MKWWNESNSPPRVRYTPSGLHSKAPAGSIEHPGEKSCAYHPRTTNTAVCSKSNHQLTFASEESVPKQQSVIAVGSLWNAGRQPQSQWQEQTMTPWWIVDRIAHSALFIFVQVTVIVDYRSSAFFVLFRLAFFSTSTLVELVVEEYLAVKN